MAPILKIQKYLRPVHFDIRYEKTVTHYPRKVIFVLMTSLITSCLNEIGTFFTITLKQFEI